MKINRALVGRLLAELTGMIMLVTLCCACCINGLFFPRDILDGGTGGGMVVLTCVHCFGFLSGSHINPAVSICAFILGLLEWKLLIAYIVIQFTGAFVGFTLIYVAAPARPFPAGEKDTFCLTNPHPDVKLWKAFLLEYMMTSVLLFACCAVWDPRNKGRLDSISIRLGFIVAGLCYVAGPYTGTSLNFARTLAPHVIQGDFRFLWIYFLSQLLAAIISPVVWRFILTGKESAQAAQD